MLNTQPLFGTLHLHSSFYFFKCPSLAMFRKNVVDMDIVTCFKWTNELKTRLLWLILLSSQQKQYSMCKIFHNCVHFLWSHFYECLFNFVICWYYENVMDCLHGIDNLKMFTNVRTTPKATITTNVWIITKLTCKCYLKNYE